MNRSNKVLFDYLAFVMKRQNSKKVIGRKIAHQKNSWIGTEMKLFLGLDEDLAGYMRTD
jgi:hypothetical protein